MELPGSGGVLDAGMLGPLPHFAIQGIEHYFLKRESEENQYVMNTLTAM
jgi:hypothetical protein